MLGEKDIILKVRWTWVVKALGLACIIIHHDDATARRPLNIRRHGTLGIGQRATRPEISVSPIAPQSLLQVQALWVEQFPIVLS